jgi:septation ring formation regulator EzrA
MRGVAKSDYELLQEKMRQLKRENAALKHDTSIVNENYILLLRDLGEYKAENAALKDALKIALAIEALDEENLNELIERFRLIIQEQKIPPKDSKL